MTNAESLNLMVAGGAAVATALATFAAFRSARSADLAQQALLEDQIRAGRRDVAQLVASCAFEFQRIQFLTRTLRVIDRTNAVFVGGLGGDRHKVAEDQFARRLAKAETLFEAARHFAENPAVVAALTPQDVDRLQVELIVKVSELRSIAEELNRESASREAKLLQHRERALKEGGRDA